jgi:hypothetical protein
MKFIICALATAVSALLAVPASAALLATATMTDSQISPGKYQYDLTLNDVGTTTIGTFWFGWVPGLNFMSATPASVTSPAGWTDNLTTGPGTAIQWLAGSNLLSPGGSLSGFSFQSTESPAQLAGFAAPPNQTFPVTTSFVYSGAPFSDTGYQFVPSVVPLPDTVSLLGLGLAACAVFASRILSQACSIRSQKRT